jgi:DNA topoisomerase IA
VIQDRKYVEQLERRFYATDLGEVVTDKLVEAFPNHARRGYTREMEGELDKVEEEHLDWIEMLQEFYGRSRSRSPRRTRSSSTPRPRSSPRPRSTAARSAARRWSTASARTGGS